MKKTGLLVMALVLAMGLLGVGYAMWADTVTISGNVTTGSLDIDVESVSSTYVYKVVDDIEGGPLDGKVRGDLVSSPTALALEQDVPPAGGSDLMLIASAVTVDDSVGTGDVDAVTMTFTNIFPTIDPIVADVVLHYTGSIPAKVVKSAENWTGTDAAALELEQMDKWTYTPNGGSPVVITDLSTLQLENSDRLKFEKWFDLSEQEASDMGLSASFSFTIKAQQWNE